MQKRQWTVVAALAVMATQTACYNTRIVTRAAPEGAPYTDRQWFTIGGLAGLSQPAGQNCQNGLAWAESRLSGTDWLINVGLSVAGGIAGSLACANSDYGVQLSCTSAGATLVPFLLSSRTVEYTCAAGPVSDRPAYLPPPSSNMAPAPAPAPAPVQ
ncbi:hypothetical protein ATI61_10685 [Archangium gephyra]|uniref:Uncharacterized protein n=1 Tax=Archangium gephyra TaxID=48 RepID=A0AAC8Q0G2_9BACT|nr:hypothetical protein [Archangium gephyra]AKI98689.1 Hypothetical protein AA314_00316 [Archangium gephyra]REG30616.1 hypothetical protein ATI61_10685 [Archangium gephyra]